jgi:serine/threonine protein kinase
MVIGLRYLHSQGIVHGSLKPRNLLIDEKNQIRICDFSTWVFEDCGAKVGSVGGLCYMAPESFEEPRPTKQVDVFAFGLVLYELLIGESVFPKEANAAQVYRLHADKKRPEIPAWIVPSLVKLIQKCWSPDPDLRPSFDEVYATLEESGFQFFDDVNTDAMRNYISEVASQEPKE